MVMVLMFNRIYRINMCWISTFLQDRIHLCWMTVKQIKEPLGL